MTTRSWAMTAVLEMKISDRGKRYLISKAGATLRQKLGVEPHPVRPSPGVDYVPACTGFNPQYQNQIKHRPNSLRLFIQHLQYSHHEGDRRNHSHRKTQQKYRAGQITLLSQRAIQRTTMTFPKHSTRFIKHCSI